MNLKTAILPLVILLSACGKKTDAPGEGPVKTTAAAVEFIDYIPPAGTYSCRAPAHWRGEKTTAYGPDEVTFLSSVPSKGLSMDKRPSVVSISISKYPNKSDKYVDAEVYAKSLSMLDGKPTVYEKKTVAGRTIVRYNRQRPAHALHSNKTLYQIREDVALIVVPGGFFEISHSAPIDAYQSTLPVFEEVVRSFKPKS